MSYALVLSSVLNACDNIINGIVPHSHTHTHTVHIARTRHIIIHHPCKLTLLICYLAKWRRAALLCHVRICQRTETHWSTLRHSHTRIISGGTKSSGDERRAQLSTYDQHLFHGSIFSKLKLALHWHEKSTYTIFVFGTQTYCTVGARIVRLMIVRKSPKIHRSHTH